MSRFLRRLEDRAFAVAAEIECRLKLAPRGVRLVPTALHRWMLRFLAAGLVTLIGVFAVTSGAQRTRALLVVALGALFSALGFLLFDARRGAKGPPRKTPSPPITRRPTDGSRR